VRQTLLNLKQAAECLNVVSPSVLRDLCPRRALTYRRIDRALTWRFKPRELDAFLERRTVRAKAGYW
jgi:hypothetical protein